MKLEEIQRIAVLGAGTMGPGIAQCYAMSGREVCLYDISESALVKARAMLLSNLDTFVDEELLTVEEADATYKRVSFTTVLAEALDGVQFVQETVAEKPQIKKSVFGEVDAILPTEAILVSNASALNPFELVPEGRRTNFAAAHWFAPPQILPLVEVAKGEETSEETMETILALLRACGKKPVRLEKYVPGYIINRIQILLNTEVFYLLENGVCTPEQMDMAVKASLMPRGMVLGLVQRYDFICSPKLRRWWTPSWMSWQRTSVWPPPMTCGTRCGRKSAAPILSSCRSVCRSPGRRSSRLCVTWSSARCSR